MISPELLRRYPYFADVNEEALKEVAMISEEISRAEGVTLCSEGDRADSLYILVEGEVDLQYTLGNGEMRTVDTLVAGDLVVWSALIEPYRATGTTTIKKAIKAIAIDGKKLHALCEANYDLGYRIMIELNKLLASRLEGARVQLATID